MNKFKICGNTYYFLLYDVNKGTATKLTCKHNKLLIPFIDYNLFVEFYSSYIESLICK